MLKRIGCHNNHQWGHVYVSIEVIKMVQNITQLIGCVMWGHTSHEHGSPLLMGHPIYRGAILLCIKNFLTNDSK